MGEICLDKSRKKIYGRKNNPRQPILVQYALNLQDFFQQPKNYRLQNDYRRERPKNHAY